MKLIFATNNNHKLKKEVKNLFIYTRALCCLR